MHLLRRPLPATTQVLLTASLLCGGFLRARAQTPAPVVTPPEPQLQSAEAKVAAAEDKPLPPVQQLLEEVEKHADRDDRLLAQYTYHVHAVAETFDGNEGVKKTESTDSESFSVNGTRLNRVVAKDGKPLTPSEAAKENERIDKEIAKARDRKARRDQKAQDQAAKQPESAGPSSDPNFITASRMLQLGTFTNERRVQLNGRPTIVLDYTGNRDVKTHNPGEKVVECLTGTVFIDEQDKEIARAEGRFFADFKLGFGLLADIHKGLNFTFEKQKVNDEVWLPHQVQGSGKASILVVVFRVHGRSTFTMSDYRKFHTAAKVLPGSQVIDENGTPQPDPAPKP